jgi:hypothetical protein
LRSSTAHERSGGNGRRNDATNADQVEKCESNKRDAHATEAHTGNEAQGPIAASRPVGRRIREGGHSNAHDTGRDARSKS